MAGTKAAPHGSWKSPITSTLVASGAVRLELQIALDGEDVYWVEIRPAEAGRSVLVRCSPEAQIVDVIASPWSARTRVHEYGGGAFAVDEGTVYFSNFTDQNLYRQDASTSPQQITHEADVRYADIVIDRRRGRAVCVSEDHIKSNLQPTNSLVGIKLDGTGRRQQLVSGNDFYSSPRVSPDGAYLAWLTWNHPSMPWDSTELWIGEITKDGTISKAVRIAGGKDESICQPKFAPDGTLYFISDRNGWWNLYRWETGQVQSLCEMEADFGVPGWIFGRSNYDFESVDQVICAYTKGGTSYLARLDTRNRKVEKIEVPYTSISSLKAAPGRVVLIAGSPTEAEAVVKLSLTTGQIEVLRRSTELAFDAGYLSIPRAIEFPTEHGLVAHAFYYPPKNRDFVAPPGERPPLLVVSHGGPTSATSNTFNLMIQYWTTRGFAGIDVDYGGSTGYGKAYRQRLDGQWGIVDVDDCVNGARYLIDRGEVDAMRIAIRGGSAGGYTTLAALTFRSLFKAGASYYGVSDLEALAKETHKFESRYLDRLIGPYPDRRDLYWERSPIKHVDKLSCPVIFFQGSEDKVVPPNQAEMMVDALRRKGVPVSYILFEGEQHGFRRSQNIKRALDAELYFYSKVFDFDLPDPIEPVPIENLA